MADSQPQKVAVIGSGMAGLAVAYLLQRDVKRRYAVTVLEEVFSCS